MDEELSGYPRPQAPPAYAGPYVPDRVVAVLRILLMVCGAVGYFGRFHRLWSRTAPYESILAWAPPLGSHVTSQASGLVHGVFVGVALWYGRGWGFAYVLVACLAVLVQALIVRPSGFAFWFDLLVYLPLFLYCGLRLFGSLGPPTGGLELRRREP